LKGSAEVVKIGGLMMIQDRLERYLYVQDVSEMVVVAEED
jgi:hypothetical protein